MTKNLARALLLVSVERTGEEKKATNTYYRANSLFLEESSRLDGLNAYGAFHLFFAGAGVATIFPGAVGGKSVASAKTSEEETKKRRTFTFATDLFRFQPQDTLFSWMMMMTAKECHFGAFWNSWRWVAVPPKLTGHHGASTWLFGRHATMAMIL